jgi:hypothetical protein
MATVVGRDRSQSTAGATRDNIMSMLGFRPRTRDQRSQSVFEPPTVDASIIEVRNHSLVGRAAACFRFDVMFGCYVCTYVTGAGVGEGTKPIAKPLDVGS